MGGLGTGQSGCLTSAFSPDFLLPTPPSHPHGASEPHLGHELVPQWVRSSVTAYILGVGPGVQEQRVPFLAHVPQVTVHLSEKVSATPCSREWGQRGETVPPKATDTCLFLRSLI